MPCLVPIYNPGSLGVESCQNSDDRHGVDLGNVCWFENIDADINPKNLLKPVAVKAARYTLPDQSDDIMTLKIRSFTLK
jgi:hypothetical protein